MTDRSRDPVLQRGNLVGAHASRAAHIEPVRATATIRTAASGLMRERLASPRVRLTNGLCAYRGAQS